VRTLSSLTVHRGKVKLEVHKPMEAIDKLARHRGLYDDEKKVDLMVNNTLTSSGHCANYRELSTAATRSREKCTRNGISEMAGLPDADSTRQCIGI